MLSDKDSATQEHDDETQAEVDIYTLHEQRAGRLVLDVGEARREFGDKLASRLKTTKDGKHILWPQPSDDPDDPQNWSDFKKNFQLFVIVLAAMIADFDSGIGIACVFALAKQYHTTTGEINNLTSNWSIFLIGWGGIFFVMTMRKWGRLSTLFWTQLIALGFMIGCTFAPTLKTFAAFRCLTAFFGTCPQVTGLYTITDLFPFHLHARKINLWALGYILAPHLSPFVFGFLVARASWRWAYGIGTLFGAVVLLLIVFFIDESMYIRSRNKPVEPRARGFKARVYALTGVSGIKHTYKEPSWKAVLVEPLKIVWRPHLLLVLVLEAVVFGFGIGINITNTVFLQSPPPFGFGFNPTTVSGIYATPVIAVFIGEVIGRYLNDMFMEREIRKKDGVFEAEARLWSAK